jgi:hypothetical protein
MKIFLTTPKNKKNEKNKSIYNIKNDFIFEDILEIVYFICSILNENEY